MGSSGYCGDGLGKRAKAAPCKGTHRSRDKNLVNYICNKTLSCGQEASGLFSVEGIVDDIQSMRFSRSLALIVPLLLWLSVLRRRVTVALGTGCNLYLSP